jgi:hypothetical protein
VVELPQQVVPTSAETAITSDPQFNRRLYGPARPVGSGSPPEAETIYTVPAATRTTVTMVLGANTDTSSPPGSDVFTLSIGADSEDTRIFNNVPVDPGIPFAIGLELTLEEGEIIQALPSNVVLTINGREVPV